MGGYSCGVIAAGATRPLVLALGDRLVVSDEQGALLWARLGPDGQPPEAWLPVHDRAAGDVVGLAGIPDLAAAGDLVTGAYGTGSVGLVRIWWRDSGTELWRPSGEIVLDAPPAGLATFLGPDGGPELVVGLADGTLVHGRLDGSAAPVCRPVLTFGAGLRGLSAIPSGTTVEVYAATTEHRLALVRRSSPVGQAEVWGPVQTFDRGLGQVVAHTSWASEDEYAQVVALVAGELRERHRRRGSGWGDWSQARATPAAAPPAALSGTSTRPGGPLLAVRLADGGLALRSGPAGGWQQARLPGRADQAVDADVIETTPLAPPDQPTERLGEDTPRLSPVVVALVDETTEGVQDVGATRLYTGRDVLRLAPADPPQVGPFRLLGRVPGGQSSSDKYVARDPRGYCFLKVLRPEADADAVTAFRREVSIARRVTDRAWLSTYVDHDDRTETPDGKPSFLALSWVPGEDLDTRIRNRGPLPGDDVVALAYDLMESVRELRECAIFHCDIKPANIILADGRRPVLVDFGSAVQDSVRQVREAAFATPGYAAPEFVRGREVNLSTDLYAWGAVVVTAATGDKPQDDPELRTGQIARLPEVLRPLVTNALGDNPGARPTLAEVRNALARRRPSSAALSTTPFGLPEDPAPTLSVRAGRGWVDLRRRAARLPGWQYRLVVLGCAGLGALGGALSGLVVRELVHVLGGGS